MNGLLLYDEAGATRNRWWIERLLALAPRFGLSLRLSVLSPGAFSEELPDFAIVRAIRPDLSRALEERGVRVFNNARVSRVANDKWETYRLCRTLGIPVLHTLRERDGTPDYPFVLKSLDGHGGTEVFAVRSAEQFAAAKRALNGKPFLMQEFCSDVGKDVRVYALGDETVAAVLRASDTDFRSNFSLGGAVTLTQATEEQKAIVRALRAELRFDFVGVDFLPHEGGWALNEIEDVVGTRMLYRCTDKDAAKLYLGHIRDELLSLHG
ncbi:MAG: RimK family alpha-L-glutamate ligase [Candidatus Gallimonas sp.]